MEENDGIDDLSDGLSRTALTVVAQVGRQLAKVVQKAHEEAAAQRTAAAADLQARLDAQRMMARAELATVHRPEWWRDASTQEIARTVEVARTWAPHDAEVAAAAQVVRHQVQERYGVDVDATGPYTSEILHATHAVAVDRAEAAKQRAAAEQEEGEARLLLLQGIGLQQLADEAKERADELEHGVDWDRGTVADLEQFAEAQEHRATSSEQRDEGEQKLAGAADLYDSAERRQAFASRLEQNGASAEQVRDRLLVDADQARHPKEAATAHGRRQKVANREPVAPSRTPGHGRGR
ncbi:hypothetical protein [Agrococcus sp. Ld7]|uniref:hypothetical protein n=1 Tax=Agrococcus sp. Ld7 TaxID=649148 RepID=UPI003867B8F4